MSGRERKEDDPQQQKQQRGKLSVEFKEEEEVSMDHETQEDSQQQAEDHQSVEEKKNSVEKENEGKNAEEDSRGGEEEEVITTNQLQQQEEEEEEDNPNTEEEAKTARPKKFYVSSTDDDEQQQHANYQEEERHETDTTTTMTTTTTLENIHAISSAKKGKGGYDKKNNKKGGGGRIPKVPTSVILNCADEKIRQAKAGGGAGGSSSTLGFGGMMNHRSISEVLRAKLSALPLREEGNFTLGCSKVFHTRTRFLMMVLCLLCLASVWSNILCFNFALICIEGGDELDDDSSSSAESNFTTTTNGTTQNPITTSLINGTAAGQSSNNSTNLPKFTNSDRLYLTSAVAAAALVANFAVVSLVNNYGIRVTFAALGVLSAVATCLLPAAINLGFYYVLACRCLQGVAFSANFPVVGAFTSKWTYYKQNGLFVSVLVAYVQFAPAVTMPVSGALCSAIGWPSVFYAHGGASVLLFTVFAIFFRNSPGKHPFVGEVELRKIAVGKSEMSKELMKKIPIIDILKTASVWAIWIAAIGNFICVNVMFLYSPMYLKEVLHFPVAHAGFSASLAPLAQFSIKLFAGFTSDKIRFLSETNKLRLYNTVAFCGSALFLCFLAFFPTKFPTICVGLLGISAGLLGFTTGGFFKAGPLVAKHFALVVMGQISLAITITLLIVPAMVSFLAPNNTEDGWRKVFLCTAAVLCVTNLAFCLMTSAKPAEWTTDDFSRSASHIKIHSTDASSMHVGGQQPQNNPNNNNPNNTMHIKQFSATILR